MKNRTAGDIEKYLEKLKDEPLSYTKPNTYCFPKELVVVFKKVMGIHGRI
jgi:hypothetical protein